MTELDTWLATEPDNERCEWCGIDPCLCDELERKVDREIDDRLTG